MGSTRICDDRRLLFNNAPEEDRLEILRGIPSKGQSKEELSEPLPSSLPFEGAPTKHDFFSDARLDRARRPMVVNESNQIKSNRLTKSYQQTVLTKQANDYWLRRKISRF